MTGNEGVRPALVSLASGACWQCGDEAPWTCDTPGCARWVCHEHTVVEAQAWDSLGADGVDIRCREHVSRSFDVRDLVRGRYLPPPSMKGHDAV
jgi:hypothetical protein